MRMKAGHLLLCLFLGSRTYWSAGESTGDEAEEEVEYSESVSSSVLSLISLSIYTYLRAPSFG